MQHAIIVAGSPVLINPEPITRDGIQHPPDIFTKWTRAEKIEVGIYEVEEISSGAGPVLDSTSPPTVVDDHVEIVRTFREKNAQEIADEIDARTAAFSSTDIAKITYGQFLGLYAVAKQVIPSLTVQQFSTALDNQFANPAFTFAQYVAWAKARL